MAERVPPPRASPRPLALGNADDMGDTGEFEATRDFVREVNRSGLFKVAVGVGGFAIVCFLAGAGIARAFAQSAEDAGVRAFNAHESRLATLEQQRQSDRTEVNNRLERVEKNQNADHELTLGVSQKVDKLLERFQVPNPAPTPRDGGQ
jgi:hypothetical protein